MFSQKALQELKEIWQKEMGEEITDEFANEQGIILLELFDKTYRPIKRQWIED